ncbi:MAG: exodeoxyribonuclease VII small subunit [Lachnospiraceae bacterium]|nr:exodeoxyribonuclease VII small subunit [Lachnospiraceae bacterium]
MEEKEFNIDKALQRLDEINRRLSEEGLPLSESLTLYKEGVELAAKCKENLDTIEKEIIILTPEE